jgi:hypothetical protein
MITLKSRSAKKRKPKWFIPAVLLALAAVGVFTYAGYLRVYPHYRHWKANRSVRQARAYFKAHDLADADVALRVAFEAGGSVDAYVLIADMLEAGGSSEAVEIRRQASQAEPENLGLRMAFAETAMHFNDDASAEEALSGTSDKDKATQAYRRVAVGWAIHMGDWPTAARLLGEMEKESAGDASLRILRAAIQIHDRIPEKSEAARAELRQMAKEPATRLAALRVLARDASDRRDVFSAMEVGDELAETPDASFDDLLGAASAQHFARPGTGASPALLERLRALATKDLLAVTQYVHWLIGHQQTDQATELLSQIPDSLAKLPEVHGLESDVLVARSDWEGLRPHLSEQEWGSLPAASIEFAYVAHLSRDRGNADLAAQSWGLALEESQGNEPALLGLARLAGAWKWTDAIKESLFAASKQFPKDARTYIRLVGLLRAQRDTRGLYATETQWLKAFPADRLQSDSAMLSLLLDPPTAPNAATVALAQLHEKDPLNPYFTTNYAYALLLLGQMENACALIDSLQPSERKQPARAPYIASIYAAAGRSVDARTVLAVAPPSRLLLPEEETLLSQARITAGLR